MTITELTIHRMCVWCLEPIHRTGANPWQHEDGTEWCRLTKAEPEILEEDQ